ncbi:MAG: [NiFe]-hydrogenase assembly chaperone HybE [Chromatiaceae bacterium]|nr:[NiFe]-hydrogenase assembly chaperone HybE [Gammaproteobacteria bacterium]MCP5317898.1 [NiFe]-hydrogenase assembly chaperone HybE [Chromatiaceae bacterium]MCW5585274.1 [NiFe]-hydrogenase assembly chaperone HybE [Chromatiales bacterium]MCP5429091.1 [NiFe]-hydrogenase assembly chaperone HybE [Chromatiaceae bacterium]MCP5436480.1 [NiFe]-hydrogenase assembly chaperone HybE [Chromatiaceae bacterium]
MNDPQAAAEHIAATFTRIHHEQMAGLPLLNNALTVETLGFQVHGGRVLGVLVTPWLMNLVLLPGQGDDWDGLELGHKQPHEFPSGQYKFMVNEIDGIGRCQTHSLFSPMREFVSQAHAMAAAEAFLRDLMTPAVADGNEAVDEELLGRIMRGEDTPEIDMQALDEGRLVETRAKPTRRLADIEVRVEDTMVSRRDLLRGVLRGS